MKTAFAMKLFASATLLGLVLASGAGLAQQADIANVPLANSPSDAVKPNLMYILDDSGSMNWNYMPDEIFRSSRGDTFRNCKRCPEPNRVTSVSTSAERITSESNHGGGVGSPVMFTYGTPPLPLLAGVVYFIAAVPSSTQFTLSATPGGAVINLIGSSTDARFTVVRAVTGVNTTSETVTGSSNHGASIGSTIMFRTGTPPAPLALNTIYYVASVPASNSFTLSLVPGGSAINLTATTTQSSYVVDGGCSGPSGRNADPGMACGNHSNDANDPADGNTTPTYGEAAFYSAQFNQIYYNPDITYSPAVNYAGVSFGNQSPTAARRDYYLDSSTVNVAGGYTEVYYCAIDNPSAAELISSDVCRRNGIHNVAPFLGVGQPTYFLYWNAGTGANQAFPNERFAYKVRVNTSNAHYFKLAANEFCSDVQLTTCSLALAGGGAPAGFSIAAPVRWCKSVADAQNPAAVSGNSGSPATPRCRAKFDRAVYQYPRYGRFTRTDIVLTTPTYTLSPTAIRSDCAGATCSYTQEIQNFANWFSYYRNRMALMKTATGRAFLNIDNRYRIGFLTINPNSPVTASKYLQLSPFEGGAGNHKDQWYQKLYAQSTNGSTPLREALARAGRHYAGRTDGINSGMPQDPVQYSCQQNFALLTTDGYWNSNAGQSIGGGSIGNQDNSNSGFTTRAAGAFDGALSGASDSLADVAAYYYKNDLRTTGPLAISENNVPTTTKDTATHQHMVTFTLGLGLKGLMDYIPDYETSTTGDFANIRAGTSGACSWTTGTCNWPVPAENAPSSLDDLWHAAVNGRGQYFSAGDPNSLAQGLQSALAALNVQTAAASASATSSPNITETDNFIYSSTFRTVKWDGEIVAQRINTTTGAVIPAIAWSAQSQLNGRTADATDSRTIFTIDEAAGGKRKNFDWASLKAAPVGTIAAERPYFQNKCGSLSQCTLLTLLQQVSANNGANLVNYLRGQREFESVGVLETTSVFRARDNVLGDPVNATPAYVAAPRLAFTDAVTPTYEDFKTANKTRTPVLFIAANDGMLHAFNGDTGAELWAYVPRIVLPKLHRLATANWGVTHEFIVDGSPRTMDVYMGGSWRTILVSGLNSGGRGYYALDVTVPTSPTVLWEFCHTNTLCAASDADIGLSYGPPLITKRPSDGKWVVMVTSGLNNVSPGDGKGYLYVLDAATGAVLEKIGTGFGSNTAPSGFSKISGFAESFSIDNTSKFVYGGDLYGNVWKFDFTASPVSASRLALLRDSGGKPQPITTRPELAEIEGKPVVIIGTGLYYGTSDLFDPATLVPPYPWAYRQSLYAIKDRGVDLGVFRSANVVQNTITDSGGITRATSNNSVDWAVKDGWYVDLNPGNTSPGERINIEPQLVQGTLVVVTNVPNNSACTVGGDSWIYTFDYKTGTVAPAATNAGTKLTGKITVGIVIVRLPSGILRGIVTTAEGTKTTVPVPTGGGANKVRRVGWRELVQSPE